MARAEVEIISDLAAPNAQGIYATPGRSGALIRSSSASDHLGPDMLLGPILGFAMNMFGIDGPKLVEDEPNSLTFDLVLKNSLTFIANTAKHYLFIEQIANDSLSDLSRGKTWLPRPLDRFLTGKGMLEQSEWTWDELGGFLKAAQTPVRNPLPSTYWTMGAVRHGDHVAKIRVAPTADSAANVTHHELVRPVSTPSYSQGRAMKHPYMVDVRLSGCGCEYSHHRERLPAAAVTTAASCSGGEADG